ncbi:hypothetical protein [Pseudomonas fluorescens]|uniref:hypothetical protein n=1 Tax=Pseudomonas fluorescens TaxID=294 RepID=UPI003D21C00B
MRPLPSKLWLELQSAVSVLDEQSPSRMVLEIVLGWLRRNYDVFMKEPFSSYGFDQFINVDEKSLPVEYSPLKGRDILHFKKIILSRQARDVEAIARFLRDSIESLAALEVDKQCPKCECWGMVVYIGRLNKLLAYQCKVCGYSQYSDGTRVGVGELDFVGVDRLRESGMI